MSVPRFKKGRELNIGTPTWKKSFQLPFESDWGLQHKIAFVEGYSVTEQLRKGDSTPKSPLYISKRLSEVSVRYCPKCAKHGYHSCFHQLICFDNCILHPEQKLLGINYPLTGRKEKSFFETINARAIDIMKNEAFRHKIETQITLGFDRVYVIDLMDHNCFANKLFRPLWYHSTLRTLQECFCNTSQHFTAARKVATITPHANESIHSRWLNWYLSEFAVPRLYRRQNELQDELQDELGCTLISKEDIEYLQGKWEQRLHFNPTEILYFMIHKEYAMICDQVGGIANFDAIENIVCSRNYRDISIRSFDTTLCDYHTYSRVVALNLVSQHCSSRQFERLLINPLLVSELSKLDNALNLIYNEMDQFISVEASNYNRNMEVTILAAIFNDILSHTASALGDLMEGGRYLTGGPALDIYGVFFCMPVSQYIAICNAGTIELWACDPNVDGLLSNITQVKEIFKKTKCLEATPIKAQV